MNILYFDCFSGISGDMTLAALLDLDKNNYASLVKYLKTLNLDDKWDISMERRSKNGIDANYIKVILDDCEEHHHEHHTHHHRNLTDIINIIDNSGISAGAKELAKKIFARLAKAEAKIHGCDIDGVNFHEVGAVDSIIDIVGSAILLDLLITQNNIEKIYSSPVSDGYGFTYCQHGKIPLPKSAFEMAVWKSAKVSFNYHIEVEGRFYSVPFEYIKRRVDVRITRGTVEVFYEGTRICSHVRLHDSKEKYSTQETHMPPNHQQYVQWNGDRFRGWAAKIGPNTVTVVETILSGYKVEQQGYRACMALLKLSDQYTPERLEAACAKGLFYTPRPSYKAIQTILKSGQDKPAEDSEPTSNQSSDFGFTRGADYYGRGRK
ncbi:MAG: LarC family nickel insertion protein [Oscillospiraceae bacterium]|nr:LarC family nickel insertion protein [Oscillospiraceae bacterium]